MAGQLELTVFQNPAGLQTIGDNIYLETFGSGPPVDGNPGDPSVGSGSSRSRANRIAADNFPMPSGP